MAQDAPIVITWIVIVLLTVLTFAGGAWLLRGRRNLWTLLSAVLVFGLAGYASQGAPDQPSASALAKNSDGPVTPGLIESRREFFDPSDLSSRFVTVSDGFARRGDYQRAAELLRGVVAENPRDGEAWLALAIALVEHAEGNITPPAGYAFQMARQHLSGNPAPAYFLGLAELRSGNFEETRDLWAAGLDEVAEDAEGREYLQLRLARLDQLLEAIATQQAGQMPPGL
ncbi:tetratricopeptide repeat protein [Altererythrobacter sp.]|nr:tetratricopeptide repeat protein [Altererythrobacter sp.]